MGNLQNFTYPNGVVHAYTYDTLNRLTQMGSSKNSSSAISNYVYTLGAAGNRTSVAELSGRTVAYVYDSLYRLTSETVTGDPNSKNGVVNYTYDNVGNRKTLNSTLPPAGAINYTYDADDRLGSDQYDPNGNTTGSGGITNAYDFENHLISHGTVAIVYDGDGNRVSETVGGVTTNYLVDTQNPTGYAQVVDDLQNGTVTRTYSYGLERISENQTINSTWTTSFYGYDGHGSVRQLTNSTGAVTDSYDYDAFGNLINSTGTTPNVYQFAGEAYDSALGLYYNRARYLNTTTGRFWTTDAFEGRVSDPISLHRYLFCAGDPTNCADPSGHDSYVETMGALGIGNVIASISVPLLINIAGATVTALILYAAAPDIEAAFDRYRDRFVQQQTAFVQALSLFWYHFNRWQNDPDSGRDGNHTIRVGLPSGATGAPEVTVETLPIKVPFFKFKISLEVYEGGKAGRVFEVDYRIGANSTLGRGYFYFRLDYLDFRSFPPIPFPHVHYGYRLGDDIVKSEHEPL